MDIIQKIKQKKELADIDDTFVKKFLTKYKLENLTPKQEKIIIKEVRQKLRILYGLFRTKQKNYINK